MGFGKVSLSFPLMNPLTSRGLLLILEQRTASNAFANLRVTLRNIRLDPPFMPYLYIGIPSSPFLSCHALRLAHFAP